MLRAPIRRLVMAALVAFPIAGLTSETAPDTEAPVLKLNVSTGGYPPYLIVSEDHEYSGIAYDVVTRIADRMGYRVEAHEIPRKRVDGLLLDGLIDATPRAREWTEEPEKFLFTDTIVPVREVFFSTADSDFQYRGELSLRGITLVTPLGYKYPQLQPLFDSGAVKRYEVSQDRDIFTFLLFGRGIDAGVADMTVGQWIIRQNDWRGKFKHSEQAISEFGYRLMVRPGWTSFVEAFNKRFEQMKASGELEEILDQYR
mgnify:CR=1 FL=1